MNTFHSYLSNKFKGCHREKFWSYSQKVNIPVIDIKKNMIAEIKEIYEGNYMIEYENKAKESHVIFGALSRDLVIL